MVGWGFAFGRGFVVLLWSIVWAIVAGIVGVLVIGGSLSRLVSNPTAVTSNPTGFITGFLAASFLGIFLIIFIAVIGLYATIVKVAVDGALSQLEKSGQYNRGSYSTGSQSMGSQPTLVAPAMRKFCGKLWHGTPGRHSEVSQLRRDSLMWKRTNSFLSLVWDVYPYPPP